MVKTGLIVAALLASAGNSASAATITGGDYTFSFSGACWDCTGTASATLKLKDYVLGSAITTSNIVSFIYDGTDLFGSYGMSQTGSVGGALSDTVGAYSFSINGFTQNINGSYSARYFKTDMSGFWATGITPAADFGSSAKWTLSSAAVPESGTWALMMLGFGGVGAVMRRRKTSLSYA